MPNSAINRLLPISRLRLAIAVLVTLACGISIAVLALDVIDKINAAASANTDNVQWTLGQVEVEMLRLIKAVDDAKSRPDQLPELRQRFDIFYNRLNIMQHGGVFANLRQNAEFETHFASLKAFMVVTAPLIDGPDKALQSDLDGMSADLHALSAEARQIAMIGVQVFGNNTDRRRAGLEQTLIKVGLVTALLVATLVCMLVVLLRLHHSNRRRAAQNIETLSRLNAVVATALDAVITVNGTGHIVDFNAAASATFGYSGGEAVGTPMSGLVLAGAQENPLFGAGSAPLISGQGRLRISARHKDGHVFPAEIAVTESVAGERPLYVAFLRDLSAQVAAEQALVKARDNALAGEKAKADLLVVMSHEIRTPLNGMIGTIELLDTTDLQAHQREYLRIMDASGKLLMHHVNDVLDIARLDSGKLPLRLGPVDMAALVGEVFDNQAPAARASGNRLTLTAAKDGRNRVIGNAVQLRQVLLNLIGNAVKFTREGKISVEIAHLGPTGPTEITVTDSGIGIATVDLERIFDDFVTLDASYARPASGTGLGLGIVKRIVAHMGGTIRVDSQRGQGSTFHVTLPLPILDAGSLADPSGETVLLGDRPTANAANLVTLVVEDNEFNRVIVRDMLVRDGHTVAEAHDGAEGIRLAAAQRFDLILMDISMPHTDGLQAARAIRAGHGASCDAPIIALTAHALQSESDRFYAGGMQAVLIKPITRETLRATISAVLRQPTPTAATSIRPADDTLNLPILHALLEDLGRHKAVDLTRKFLTETEADLQALAAISANDPIVRDVHRLQGSASMFGATALHAALAQIESLCKSGDNTTARTLVPGLVDIWRDTTAAYRAEGVLPQLSSLR